MILPWLRLLCNKISKRRKCNYFYIEDLLRTGNNRIASSIPERIFRELTLTDFKNQLPIALLLCELQKFKVWPHFLF